MKRVRWYPVAALGLAALTTAVALPGVATARSQPKAHTAIVGGEPAPTGTLPWLAFIDDNLGAEGDYNCTGTVIAPNLVLTAAHCGEDPPSGVIDNVSNFTVVTGTLDKTDTSLGQVSGVTEIIPHATEVEAGGTDGATIIGDAALLVLATPTTAQPITLADSTDLSLVLPGTEAFIAGWGLTNGADLTSHPDLLQFAPTVVQGSTECLLDNPTFDSQAQVCALDTLNGSASTCGGDSGGPLVVQNADSQWVEIGITSTSGPDCDPSYPQYFTRVDYIEPWAQSCIADTTACSAAVTPSVPVATPAPSPPAAPAPAPLPAPAAVQPPVDGSYAGRSSQHSGHVNLTVTSGAVTNLTLKYNLRCRRRERGPLVQAYTRAIPLTLTNGVWGFSVAYRSSGGLHFFVMGAFSAAGAVAGRLTVQTHNAQCHSGTVAWTLRAVEP
jgi:secreted trypsin-like serine protease